jgi:hypothetical protein
LQATVRFRWFVEAERREIPMKIVVDSVAGCIERYLDGDYRDVTNPEALAARSRRL